MSTSLSKPPAVGSSTYVRPLPAPDEEASPAGRSARTHAAPEARAKPLRLAIAEQNGSLQIVAGTTELSAEERARLRRAVAAIAAEFGLTLDTLTLNGSAEPNTFSPIGEVYGDHRG